MLQPCELHDCHVLCESTMHLPRPVHLQTLCTAFRHFPGLEYVAQRAVPLHHPASRRDESISLPFDVRMPEPLIKRRYPLFRAIGRSSAALRASRLPRILQGHFALASHLQNLHSLRTLPRLLGFEYVSQRAVPLHHLGDRQADESIFLPFNVIMPPAADGQMKASLCQSTYECQSL